MDKVLMVSIGNSNEKILERLLRKKDYLNYYMLQNEYIKHGTYPTSYIFWQKLYMVSYLVVFKVQYLLKLILLYLRIQ
jgi:hypothetical protein